MRGVRGVSLRESASYSVQESVCRCVLVYILQ